MDSKTTTNDINKKSEAIKQWARAFEMLLEMDKKADPQLYRRDYDDNRDTNNAN